MKKKDKVLFKKSLKIIKHNKLIIINLNEIVLEIYRNR